MRLTTAFLTGAVVVLCSWFIFRKVGDDYHRNGKLTRTSSFLETAVFFLHGVSSYAFLDSRVRTIQVGSTAFILAIVLIAVGVIGVLAIMAHLGWGKTVGQDVDGLQISGIYRYTRNPQLVTYLFVVLGYSLLWPSWTGLFWVGLYLVIAHIMVRTEEAHLLEQYGDAYSEYCQRTPRYIGFPHQTPE